MKSAAIALAACWLAGTPLNRQRMSEDMATLLPANSSALPHVFAGERADLISLQLKQQAATAFQLNRLPVDPQEWRQYRTALKATLARKTGVAIQHNLPLEYRETGRTHLNGYTVKNILFQTRPRVYATANLYVPDGQGPFPAVINMHGHWREAKAADMIQPIGHTLALNGYVCLTIDAWGAGERTSVHGEHEYHGANLGASLMNIGETLMGMQLTDNIRGVDLLCSLPYVDDGRIGATGASGGGNQTMWLTAMDERIKAAVPVVSVGTFEAYVLNSNCICELLPDGLTFTEEAGVLALAAPRAIKICNALNDSNKSFFASEMLRSYKNAAAIYDMQQAGDKLSYQLFNTTHGYWPEIRETMLGWFNLQLKQQGNGAPVKEKPFQLLPPEKLMVFPPSQRQTPLVTTAGYCRQRGSELQAQVLKTTQVSISQKRKELDTLLRTTAMPALRKAHHYGAQQGWERVALETSDNAVIPLLLRAPVKKEQGYVIICHPAGKDSIPAALLQELESSGAGLALIDLWGCGEQASPAATAIDGALPPFHTLSRSALWLGQTVMGKWAQQLQLAAQYLRQHYGASKISMDGSREAGLAALFSNALYEGAMQVTLRNSPPGYLFDERAGIDYFSMALHVPGILPWGDVALAAAMNKGTVRFIQPVSTSGRPLTEAQLKTYGAAYAQLRKAGGIPGQTVFP